MAAKLDRARSFSTFHPGGPVFYEQDGKKFKQDGEEYFEPVGLAPVVPEMQGDAGVGTSDEGEVHIETWVDPGRDPEEPPEPPKAHADIVWGDVTDLSGFKMKQLRAEYVRLSGGKKLPAGTSKAVAREAIYELRVKE